MSREYAPTELKRRLRPALEELEKSGFLEPLGEHEKYVNVEKGKWRILFVRGPRRRAEEESARPLNTAEALQKELTSRHVHHLVAKDLVAKHPLDRIRAKIEVFDWLMEHSEEHVVRKPAGYLVASIRDDYATPDDFVPKLKRARKKKTVPAPDQAELNLGANETAIPANNKTETSRQSSSSISKPAASNRKADESNARPAKHAILADPETEKRLADQWQALPDDLRAEIVAQVNREHGGLLRWPALMQPLYLERMFETYADTPPEAARPTALDATNRILQESGGD
jgi:hypothetical protein